MYKKKNHQIKSSYDTQIEAKYENDYEFNRWCIRSRNRAEYAMTYAAVKRRLAECDFSRALEVGPGPGTWTRLLYRKNPAAAFTLVDISQAMKKQFELEMRELPNVSYEVTDVMGYESAASYDLFFSSRAVEYFDDKPAFFKKLQSLISADGTGVVVTKNPHHGVRKSKVPGMLGQIPMLKMQHMLEENGFTDVAFYAAVRRIPIISRLTSELAEYLFEKGIDTPLNPTKKYLTVESYIVTFKKVP